ncbi:MAG: hypothetical protein AB4911_10810 [Oscillochloridaceae bacterium umkhey_bin13]
MSLSPAFVIALAVSSLLGFAGGAGLRWAGPEQGWNLFTAAFLWTLITMAGTTIGRFTVERVRQGEWRRAIRIALIQSLPLTTIFLIVATLLSTGEALSAAAPLIFYGVTVILALVLIVLGVVGSPFRS